MLESLRARWWQHAPSAGDEDGITLVEVMVAGFVLTVAVLALASVASTSLMSLRDSRERDRATAAASSALEAVRALDYDEVALRTGGAWSTAAEARVIASGGEFYLDHDADGNHTERIWHTSTGAIDPYICDSDTTACDWYAHPADTWVTVRLFVSWYCSDDADPCDTMNHDGKRITAIATWDDPALSGPRQVRMSTIISPASRGLPAPAFEVIPDALAHTYDFSSTVNRYERCFDHMLNNYGASDSYDVVPGAPAGSWAPVDAAGQGTWRWTDGSVHWYFRAFLVPADEDFSHPDALMRDVEGDGYLDTGFSLLSGESARVRFCYTPGNADGNYLPDDGHEFVFVPRVRSRFDPLVHEDVTHDVDVRWDVFDLYLHHHDWVGESIHLRPIRARGTVTVRNLDVHTDVMLFDQFPMTEDPPPSYSSMPNYDLGLAWLEDPDNPLAVAWPDRSGLYLPAGPVAIDGVTHVGELFAAEWDHHLPSSVTPLTLGGTAAIRIWTAFDPSEESSPPPRSRSCFRGELVRISGDGHDRVAEGYFVARATAPWAQRQVLLDWSEDVTFGSGDWLRLRLWNHQDLIDELYDEYLSGDLSLSQLLSLLEISSLTDLNQLTCVGNHIGFGANVSGSDLSGQFNARLRMTPR